MKHSGVDLWVVGIGLVMMIVGTLLTSYAHRHTAGEQHLITGYHQAGLGTKSG